ncbi:MAG TPA: diguanylate cyclase [bacterium]|nr:diguanylate cyclase [bacterium]
MNADRLDPGASSPLPERLRVVVVGDGLLRDDLAIEMLVRAGFVPEWRRVDEEAVCAQVLAVSPDVVLAEYSASSVGATRVLEFLKTHGSDIPLILVSGVMDPETAVDLVRRGAADYVSTNRLERLGSAVRRALHDHRWHDPARNEGVLVDITARKNAEDEIARRTMQLETFAEVGKRLREADRVEQIYALLVETAMALLGAQHGTLNLMDADRQRFTWVHTAGVLKEAAGVTFPVAASFSERVITTGAPYVIADIAQAGRLPWLPPAYYETLGPLVIVPVRSEHDIVGTLALSRVKGAEAHSFSNSEVWLLNAIAEIGGTAIRRAQLRENLEQAYIQMVLALARTVDARDSYTGTHSEHLAVWVDAVGRELGCDEEELRALRWGALLHDIGKIGVPDEILRKPGPLTDKEWAVMRKHPAIGEEILRPVEHMGRVAALVRHHQEWWDGTGYPDGLRGDAISLGARIVAVADAYGAMMDDRAYRKGRAKEDALRDLRRAAGTQFDPRVVDVFCRLMEQDMVSGDAVTVRPEEGTAMRPAVQAIARSLTQARQAGRVMPVMADVVKRLLRPLDLPTVLDEILSQIQEVFSYPVCAICLLDEQAQELRVAAQRGHDPAVTDTLRIRVGEQGITGWVARHGRPYYTADVAHDPLYLASGPGVASEVAYPLIVDGRVLGVLDVESPAVDAFPRDVRDVLETFATLAGLAILRAQHDDDLRRLALTDGLTGLANHRALWDALEREVARALRDGHFLSVLMVEIDRFKLANDHFGHLQGDVILSAVADVLKQHTRAGDLAARFGGDEFVLLLPGASKEDAAGIAERVRRYVEEIPGDITSLTASIGVATMPEDGDTPRALIEASDRAMYQAKYIGGNRVNIA